MVNHDNNHKTRIKMYIETLVGALLGIILGFIVDMIFTSPNNDESVTKLVFMITIQVVVDATIIFIVMMGMEKFKMFDQDRIEGMVGYLIFTVLFFMIQTGLLMRMRLLYHKLTGKTLPE